MNAFASNTKKMRPWRRATLPLICLIVAVARMPLVVNGELSAADEDLFAALREEDIPAAAAALAAGANINAISPRGQQTPLMQSVLHGRPGSVSWCLNHGADTTIAEKDGYTPMHGAAFQGHAHIADMLMRHGVPMRDIHKDGFEPASEFIYSLLLRAGSLLLVGSRHLLSNRPASHVTSFASEASSGQRT